MQWPCLEHTDYPSKLLDIWCCPAYKIFQLSIFREWKVYIDSSRKTIQGKKHKYLFVLLETPVIPLLQKNYADKVQFASSPFSVFFVSQHIWKPDAYKDQQWFQVTGTYKSYFCLVYKNQSYVIVAEMQIIAL